MPSPDSPTVSVIVVSYNTRDMTLACLAALRIALDGLNAETIVVDNASADGSAAAIRAAHPSMRLIARDDNLGFAAANNLAAKEARGRRLLLLNPDTVVRPDAIAALLRFAEANPHARIWGGRTLFGDGRLNPTSCWRDMSLWSLLCFATGASAALPRSALFNTEAYGGWDRDSARAVDIVTGCFLLIDTDLWRSLDGFDLRFFMYAEEADLCRRARALGAQPMITPEAVLVHYGGASETVRSTKIARLFRAKLQLADKHWSRPAAHAARLLLGMSVLARMAGYGLAGRALGRDGLRRKAGEWSELWSLRQQWLTGAAGGGPV